MMRSSITSIRHDQLALHKQPYSIIRIFPTVKPAKPPIKVKAHSNQMTWYLNL
jgi:hypothetical protein